jgi:hypothetical protein
MTVVNQMNVQGSHCAYQQLHNTKTILLLLSPLPCTVEYSRKLKSLYLVVLTMCPESPSLSPSLSNIGLMHSLKAGRATS